jgi:hypothetical protein
MTAVLEEKDAIHETIAEYCFHFDGGEFDKWVDLFTDDGVFDAGQAGVQKGKDALRAFLKISVSPMVTDAQTLRDERVIKVMATRRPRKVISWLFAKGRRALVNG